MIDDLNHIAPLRRGLIFMIGACFYMISCAQSVDEKSETAYDAFFQGEAISFLGDTLMRPVDDSITYHQKDSMLQDAWELYETDSNNLDNIIWLGRSLAYMHRYREAIDVYSRGIGLHPKSPELYRHRGHRYITIRKPDQAIADFEKGIALASDRGRESEPDGMPNKLHIPLSNLHFNLYYHLGLAHYLNGNFSKAKTIYMECMKHADNNDLQVAAKDWLFLSSMRSGDTVTAQSILRDIHPNMEIIENEDYLTRLLMYKGEDDFLISADTMKDRLRSATIYYGMSCVEEFHGDSDQASYWRKEIIDSGFWPAFSYLAAEADSARLKK